MAEVKKLRETNKEVRKVVDAMLMLMGLGNKASITSPAFITKLGLFSPESIQAPRVEEAIKLFSGVSRASIVKLQSEGAVKFFDAVSAVIKFKQEQLEE